MNRFKFLLTWAIGSWLVLTVTVANAQPVERPNFVFLISEDTSKHHLKLFDEVGTGTPNIQQLADAGLIFRHAFSNSPVCSVARSTLMTSCYPTRLGIHHHRTERRIDLPPDIRPFPVYLREAGYYTTNKVKTDYNFTGGNAAWDESSREATWRNREDGQPFFHMQSFPVSHEGRLHFPASDVDEKPIEGLDEIFVQPRHPDTKLFRYTRARYHQQIQKMDEQVGAVIDQLRDDGLLESTFIFYFGDHGGPLPGSKAYLYETGLHVPLVVRIPERFRDQIGFDIAGQVDDFVSFVDLGPTLLHLAGLETSDKVDGRPFLGSGVYTKDTRNITFGFADRFDERIGMVRSVRRGQWKYVRNYYPWYFDSLQTNYRYKMAAYRQWREMFEAGELNEAQSQFFVPHPAESLYDLSNDPYETRNLASEDDYAEQLHALRGLLTRRQRQSPDLGFYPESYLREAPENSLYEFATDHAVQIKSLMMIADHSVESVVGQELQLVHAMEAAEDPWEVWWALSACLAGRIYNEPLHACIEPISMKHEHPLVRMRALEYLALVVDQNPAEAMLQLLGQARSQYEVAEILNSIVMLRDGEKQYDIPVTADSIPEQFRDAKYVQRRLEYLAK